VRAAAIRGLGRHGSVHVFFVIELKSRVVEIAGIAVDPASDQPFVMSCKITTNR